MTGAQAKAWSILTDEEKTAITLSATHSKSTWEAGEIMGKAHYKYLEINQRAMKFFRLFTEYFEVYPKLIPDKTNLDPTFKKYISTLIESRRDMISTIKVLRSDKYKTTKLREVEISKGVYYLKNSKITQENNLYHLIMDFDRWNNFRILPQSIQEPSAFKRRNKHKLRKLVNLFTSLHPIAVMKIKQLYEIKKIHLVKEYVYLPLITVHDNSLSQVIKIANTPKNMDFINKTILYVFRLEHDAQDFLKALQGYIFKDRKHCRDGQMFWPEFRVLTKKALNYDEINNLAPSRKSSIDMAFPDNEMKVFISKRAKADEDRVLEKNQKKRLKK